MSLCLWVYTYAHKDAHTCRSHFAAHSFTYIGLLSSTVLSLSLASSNPKNSSQSLQNNLCKQTQERSYLYWQHFKLTTYNKEQMVQALELATKKTVGTSPSDGSSSPSPLQFCEDLQQHFFL